MTELYYSPNGDDAAPGTDALPKRDPSIGTADAKWLQAGGEYLPSGRVKAALLIGAWGSGAPPRLNGRGVVDIGVDLINSVGTTVQDVDLYGFWMRGVHGGITGDSPTAPRLISLKRLHVHDIDGQPDAIGVQMWGAGISYEDVLVERTRSDSIWHRGSDIAMRRVTLVDPSSRGEGMGDCLQTVDLSTGIDIRGLTAIHYTRDKQAVLISGSGTLPPGACVIDGLTAAGYSCGAGLVTIQGIRGINGSNWNLSMPSGPANAGVAWIDGAGGNLVGGSLIGYPGAVAGRNNGSSTGRMIGFTKLGWAPGGIA